MPDLSVVEETLVELVAEALTTNTYSSSNLYEPGDLITSNATVLATVNNANVPVNVMCRAYRGWPVPEGLRQDLANGVTNISVFSVQGMSRLLPGYLPYSYVASCVPITFTATVTGLNQVTFGGTATAGQVTGIAPGSNIIRPAYCMRLTNNDTPTSVAAALAAIIPGGHASGPVVTIDNVHDVLTGVAGDSTVNTEIARYCQMIDIHIWSPNPESRDAVRSLITTAFALNLDIHFPDGSDSEISYYRGTWTDDNVQATTEWHTYIRYEVPYPISTYEIDPGILFIGVDLNSVHLVGEFDYRTI